MEFKIMGKKGDAVMDYDVETGRIKFLELLEENMLPVEVTPDGKNKAMTKFNPDVEKVIWFPRLKGG